jgi:CheY-like chemotaxis protein
MRGAALVRKLRAFGRRHDLAPRVWASSVLLTEFHTWLHDTLPDTIALEWPTDMPNASVSVDRDAFSQVLAALASNAIEAMSGSGTLRVSVRLTADELPLSMRASGIGAQAIEIGLSDTGPGMSAEARARAFEPFYTTKAAERGTGMGLAIVHGLVTQMGGGVALRDDPHGGTIATVLLPVLRDATQRPVLNARVAGRPQVVLLVDDDAPVRRSCARLLERLGLSVATAVHGRDALDQLAKGPLPDLVVSDVMMPEMGGAELVHAIRQRGWTMPVLLVSGYAAESLTVISLKDPHTSVLPKPWSIEDMTHALASRFDDFP